jgi:hypothetical protein
MTPGAQNMKTGPGALGTVERKTSPGAQNMKMAADAMGTAEIESGRAKLENVSRRPRYRRKRIGARNT